ncbi:MAG: hypothetical protein RQ885_07945 [Desulfurococcales archaeon]|jgi:transcription initiation factor IIE alpha subunit|nr:hypothetical protein [Desulfurococcales archaeon]
MGTYSKALAARNILEILVKRGGAMKDRELYEHLRKTYDISYKEFLSLLLFLEINGYITVETISEDARAVNIYYKKMSEKQLNP